MSSLNNRIDTWIFDLDNTLYSADSGIFQQVHELMGKYVSNHLKIEINEANAANLISLSYVLDIFSILT